MLLEGRPEDATRELLEARELELPTLEDAGREDDDTRDVDDEAARLEENTALLEGADALEPDSVLLAPESPELASWLEDPGRVELLSRPPDEDSPASPGSMLVICGNTSSQAERPATAHIKATCRTVRPSQK